MHLLGCWGVDGSDTSLANMRVCLILKARVKHEGLPHIKISCMREAALDHIIYGWEEA
jgi:hypothetical protein